MNIAESSAIIAQKYNNFNHLTLFENLKPYCMPLLASESRDARSASEIIPRLNVDKKRAPLSDARVVVSFAMAVRFAVESWHVVIVETWHIVVSDYSFK